jgi:membrane protein implicated in regulation of membrane protease activity
LIGLASALAVTVRPRRPSAAAGLSDGVSRAFLGYTPWKWVLDGLPFLGLAAVVAWSLWQAARRRGQRG